MKPVVLEAEPLTSGTLKTSETPHVRACYDLVVKERRNMANSRSTDPHAWTAADLSFGVQELRREFPPLPSQGIEAAIAEAAKSVPSKHGRVELLKQARIALRAL